MVQLGAGDAVKKQGAISSFQLFTVTLQTMNKKKVLVAMSGGVDSSAVCLLLRDRGYEVIGMTMRVWDLPRQFTDGHTEPDFIESARELAARLEMEHIVVDVREEFRENIVRYFTDEYRNGRTPNPCVHCNRDFKFRLLHEWADRLDCHFMATGNYVKTECHNGRTYLLMGDDARKDQSYFLWRVPQETLKRCIFPLGDMEKPQVRRYLDEKGFAVRARQSESMEVCFVEGDYRDFLNAQCPGLENEVAGGCYVDSTGRRLGTHRGVPFYTVGQRKGLGIALGRPAYVVRLNAGKNTIVLGTEEDLQTKAFFAEDLLPVSEAEFYDCPELAVRIRYHSRPVPCRVERMDNGRLLVRTKEAVSAVTPGQSAVFYVGQRLVGGAVIASQKGIGLYL